jgi:DNA-binding response OmpR family regulator
MRILVAEDLPVMAKALCTMLRHYAVDVADEGEAAWRFIEAYDYDLLILEEARLNGVDLCRRVRSRGKQMPILLVSQQSNSHQRSLGLDAGADDYMVQPIDPEELVARVRALLRRRPSTNQPVLSWGDLHLESSSRVVTYGQSLLNLTPKEYALLELLLHDSLGVLHERRVFSYGSIIENLWMGDDSPGEEAVRTHIKGLRHKLKLAGLAKDPIETVYGVGYRLRPPPESLAPQPLQILVADPDLQASRELQQAAASAAINLRVVRNRPSLRQELTRYQPQMLLLDAYELAKGDLAATAELFAEIRQGHPDLPLLLWSQRSDLALRRLALDYSVCRFLPKPIAPHLVFQSARWVEQQYLGVGRSILIFSPNPHPPIQQTVEALGYRSQLCSDAEKLWSLLAQVNPLLAIVDDADASQAVQLCWLLRNDGLWGSLPILRLSHTVDSAHPWSTAFLDQPASWQPTIQQLLSGVPIRSHHQSAPDC